MNFFSFLQAGKYAYCVPSDISGPDGMSFQVVAAVFVVLLVVLLTVVSPAVVVPVAVVAVV